VFYVTVSTVEAESVEEYRVNVLNSFRLMPQGGSRADYRTWTESIPGVREVYPYVTPNSAGEIDLYVEAFPDDSEDGHGTPTVTIKSAVQSAIEPDKIPMTVLDIHYLDIILAPIQVIITNLSDAGKLSEISLAITNYIYGIRPYIAGADIATDVNKGRMYASEIIQLIIETGVTFDDVEVQVDSAPITTYEFTNGIIPYLDSVTNV